MTLAIRLTEALATPLGPGMTLIAADSDELVGDGVPIIAAAVLVAVTDRPEPGVILTQRTDTLRQHAGQVAFPGGRVDAGDADVVAAALREADEEIALDPGKVSVIGTADRYRTGTGFEITPVLGIVAPDIRYRPSEAEVASVFEVPLAYLFDPRNHLRASAQWKGRTRHFYEIVWRDRRIWGATAALIVNLSRRIAWP